jgi:hypothetical protein
MDGWTQSNGGVTTVTGTFNFEQGTITAGTRVVIGPTGVGI